MANAKRNFFLLFDMDGSTSKGRSGWSVSRGPRKINETTKVDTGCMWGRLCYRSDKDSDAHVNVYCNAEALQSGQVELTITLTIPAGAKITECADGKKIVEIVSAYTP